jgi:phosphatidylinositol-3-phosphatase
MRLVFLIAVAGCGGSTDMSVNQVPRVGHVFVVVEENANYADVVGTGAMPYLDTLIGRGGLATQYYANTHPSIGNYFLMTVGQIVTTNDRRLRARFGRHVAAQQHQAAH